MISCPSRTAPQTRVNLLGSIGAIAWSRKTTWNERLLTLHQIARFDHFIAHILLNKPNTPRFNGPTNYQLPPYLDSYWLDLGFCSSPYSLRRIQTRLCQGFMNWQPKYAAALNAPLTFAFTSRPDGRTILLVNFHGLLHAHVGVDTFAPYFLLTNIFYGRNTNSGAKPINERVPSYSTNLASSIKRTVCTVDSLGFSCFC